MRRAVLLSVMIFAGPVMAELAPEASVAPKMRPGAPDASSGIETVAAPLARPEGETPGTAPASSVALATTMPMARPSAGMSLPCACGHSGWVFSSSSMALTKRSPLQTLV